MLSLEVMRFKNTCKSRPKCVLCTPVNNLIPYLVGGGVLWNYKNYNSPTIWICMCTPCVCLKQLLFSFHTYTPHDKVTCTR